MVKQYIKQGQAKAEAFVKKNKFPLVTKTYSFLLRALRPLYFTNEFLLANGLKLKNNSTSQSIIFFSVHKSASTFIKNTVVKLLGEESLVPVNLSGYFSSQNQKKYYNDPVFMNKVLKERGYFFGAIRNYYPFPNLGRFKVLLVLRDPRDVLTSHYFSTLFNHPLGRKEVMQNREKYKNVTIDEFVLQYADELVKKYDDYSKYLLPEKNILFLKYEDMITDFPVWLQKLAAFLNVENKKEVIEDIIMKTSFKVEKENPNSFKRSVKAGDHINKLKPETIDSLNKMFEPSMQKFNYAI